MLRYAPPFCSKAQDAFPSARDTFAPFGNVGVQAQQQDGRGIVPSLERLFKKESKKEGGKKKGKLYFTVGK